MERGGGWDWGKFAAAVTSLTAIAALLFTALSLQQTRDQNQLAESGQITDRFNAAVMNLGSGTETIRIGGIYALQRIMQDSARDQPAVMQVLAAFIRQKAPNSPAASGPSPKASSSQVSTAPSPAIDIQAALTILGARNPINDQGTSIDLYNTGLSGADLTGANLDGADLIRANLTSANLDGADLTRADLDRADLWGTSWCSGATPVHQGGYVCTLLG